VAHGGQFIIYLRRMMLRPRVALSCSVLLISGVALTFAACGGDDTTGIGGGNNNPDAASDSTMVADTLVLGADTSNQDSVIPPGDDGASDTGSEAEASCLGAFDAAGLNDAAIQSGRALILNKYHCYNCHQSQPLDAGLVLSGHNTPLAEGGSIYPPNLTPDEHTGLGCWTADQIERAIRNGFDNEDASLCVMPKFAATMDASAAMDIIEFLRSLPPVSNQVPNTVCPAPKDAGDGG
jgi:hypothetical protein